MADDNDTLRRLWHACCQALYVVVAEPPARDACDASAADADTSETNRESVVPDRAAAVLRIDHYSPFLSACYRRHGVRCAAFLTACNPRSRSDLTVEENARRQAVLIGELGRRGLRWLPGEGRDAQGLWREPSVLVLGISRGEALGLAEQAEQYGVVHAGEDAVPRLLACGAMAEAGVV